MMSLSLSLPSQDSWDTDAGCLFHRYATDLRYSCRMPHRSVICPPRHRLVLGTPWFIGFSNLVHLYWAQTVSPVLVAANPPGRWFITSTGGNRIKPVVEPVWSIRPVLIDPVG